MPTHPFPAFVPPGARALILGSFPSVQSRAQGFYYGNRQNRFWPMLALLLDEPLPLSVTDKQAMLAKHRIALWDVIGSCDITGSSDGSIRNPVPNDIGRLLSASAIRAVLLNGKTAGALFVRHIKEPGVPFFILPSTSPANAAWSLPRLMGAWREHLPL